MLASDDVAFEVTEAASQPARRHLRIGLALKLALAFVGLVSFVLVVNGSVDMWLGYREAENAAVQIQQEKAQDAAQRIERVRVGDRAADRLDHPAAMGRTAARTAPL